jgi:hypothetical protein
MRRPSIHRSWPSLVCLVLCFGLLGGCSSDSESSERVLGQAYAGPAVLKLRKEIPLRSGVVATVHHGDRLLIVGRRRRFVKVRTQQGAEGWTDMRQLLSAGQMQQLKLLAERARGLPSQGEATVYDLLNVHTEPNRHAPNFSQIKEGELVDVVAHELVPREPFEPGNILQRPSRAAPKTGRNTAAKSSSQTPPPPMPPAPPLPANWFELSRSNPPDVAPPAPSPPPEPVRQVRTDSWSLVRLADGRAGWALTKLLRMNIPDEVAQYSEGHRITSYFSLGDVKDGAQIKHNWLWTTIANLDETYQFDSFRYFIWNVRRHRYETAYIERNLKGYYPIEVQSLKAKSETVPVVSLIVEDDASVRWRKTYTFQTYHVKLIGKTKWQPPPSLRSVAPSELSPPVPAARPSLYTRVRRTLGAWKRRIFGK